MRSCDRTELVSSCCKKKLEDGFGGFGGITPVIGPIRLPAFGPWANASVILSVLTSERVTNGPGPLKRTSDQVGPRELRFLFTTNCIDPPKTPFPEMVCF